MAEVQIRNVTKSFGHTEVIHGVSVDIADGEFIVIVGPSGCGKSTLLRMVAGLEAITTGEITIDGQVVNGLEPKDRNIAMVFQNYALYPHMSVYDNMAYGLRNRKIPKAEIDRKVGEAAEILQLEGLLERRPSQLSGGQRQRVAMGRAIVRNPKVFLFDEPLSNLDAKLRVSMRIEIRRLQRELGITAIYVTHDQVEAMTMADRLIAMNDGNAEQIGAPMSLYNHPSTRFVAGFIGSPPMNFFDFKEVRSLALPIPSSGDSDRLTVGIRPEHLEVVAPDVGNIGAVVEMVEPLGAETLAYVRLDNGTGSGTTVTVRSQGSSGYGPGDAVGLRYSPDKFVLFDSDGRRVD